MVTFVWSSEFPFLAGAGGSENYTAGQIRELMRRGIPTRIITLGHGENDGREDFPDITFTALESKEALSDLDDTLVFVTYPLDVKTKRQSYVIVHCPLTAYGRRDPLFNLDAFKDKHIIAPSRFAAKSWGKILRKTASRIPAVYPFAEKTFSQVQRPERKTNKTRILFAGRLIPDKGVYTLLAALHMHGMRDLDYELTVTTAGMHAWDGQLLKPLLEQHPLINLVPARRTAQEMAQLMAEHDIVVMPSTNIFWSETFGIVSVEAQHAGCRVVASNSGGLPETNCGGLMLVRPDDPRALANGLVKAASMGSLTVAERAFACTKFTVASSVDTLLKVMEAREKRPDILALPLPKKGTLVREQLDLAVQGVRKLGLRMTGDEELV